MRVITLLGPALLLGTLLPTLSNDAQAGSVGVVGTGGVHTAKAYYYDAAGEQGVDSQVRPNGGFGLEGTLGASDDKIVGLLRVCLIEDAPEAVPDIGDLDPDEVTMPPYEGQPARSVGVLNVGVQWGLLGDPEGFQMTLNTTVGTGFLTKDSTEYFLAEVGPGLTFNFTEKLQLAASATANARYRKGFSVGGNVYAGVRFLFD